MTPEGRVKFGVKKILDQFGKRVWYYMPVQTGYGSTGIPDFVVCAAGWFFGVECKAGKGELTPLQLATLMRIQDAGGYTLIVRENDMDLLRAHVNMMATTPR